MGDLVLSNARLLDGRGGTLERATVHVAEWRALLDRLQADERWAAGPFGWWGVSMGTTHGLPLAARDPRIAASVFGLNALRPGDEAWARQASADSGVDAAAALAELRAEIDRLKASN